MGRRRPAGRRSVGLGEASRYYRGLTSHEDKPGHLPVLPVRVRPFAPTTALDKERGRKGLRHHVTAKHHAEAARPEQRRATGTLYFDHETLVAGQLNNRLGLVAEKFVVGPVNAVGGKEIVTKDYTSRRHARIEKP